MPVPAFFPPAGTDWPAVAADATPFDGARLAAAVAFAEAHDSPMDRDIGVALAAGHFSEPPPLNEIIGPVTPRGGPAGLPTASTRRPEVHPQLHSNRHPQQTTRTAGEGEGAGKGFRG